MCVMLRLFSTLSRRVGTLQISIIINIGFGHGHSQWTRITKSTECGPPSCRILINQLFLSPPTKEIRDAWNMRGKKQGGTQQYLYAHDLHVYIGVHCYCHHFAVCKDLQSNWPCFGFCDPLWPRSFGETPTSTQKNSQAFSLMTCHGLPQIRNGGHCEWVQT